MNPKDAAASSEARDPLDLLEPAADRQIARALADGRDKYGLRNFTEPGNQIGYRVYLAAMRRHITALLEGEDTAPDSGHHHLAHVGANVHVLLAAIEAGTLHDDRDPHSDEVERQGAVEVVIQAAQPGLPPRDYEHFLKVFGG